MSKRKGKGFERYNSNRKSADKYLVTKILKENVKEANWKRMATAKDTQT